MRSRRDETVRLNLECGWTEKLSRMPESGMGYQRVRVRLKMGLTIEDALVFNGSVLQVSDDLPAFNLEDIADIELVRGNP
jgi:hypothetical protein